MLSKLYELALDLVPEDVDLYSVKLERTRYHEDAALTLTVSIYQDDVWGHGHLEVQEDPVVLEYAVDEAVREALETIREKHNEQDALRDVLRTHSAEELVAAAKKGGLEW